MEGKNLYESPVDIHLGQAMASGPRMGVFISYSRLDLKKASLVADLLRKKGISHYFDRNHDDLQKATEKNDHSAVVEHIEKGLSACSHLLGIITENTKKSWWVPYEIGNARGRGKACAHLIEEDVLELPSYIQAGRILLDRESLQAWLPKEPTDKGPIRLVEIVASSSLSFVPERRSASEITFY